MNKISSFVLLLALFLMCSSLKIKQPQNAEIEGQKRFHKKGFGKMKQFFKDWEDKPLNNASFKSDFIQNEWSYQKGNEKAPEVIKKNFGKEQPASFMSVNKKASFLQKQGKRKMMNPIFKDFQGVSLTKTNFKKDMINDAYLYKKDNPQAQGAIKKTFGGEDVSFVGMKK